MSTPAPALANLARRLIACETARAGPPNSHAPVAVRALEKLQVPLSTLAGTAGFHSLVSRALALAKPEHTSLNAVRVGANGSLEGLAGDRRGPDAGTGEDGEAAVVAHLLGLLVTFIGAPLMVRLVGEAWPDALLDE